MPALPGGQRGQIAQALVDFPRKTKAIHLRNLRDALTRVQKEAQRLIDRPGPPASSPGEPPRRRSGRLQRDIVVEIDDVKLIGQIRSTAPYSAALEKGSKKRNIAPRPFLSVAWARTKKDVAAIMSRRK